VKTEKTEKTGDYFSDLWSMKISDSAWIKCNYELCVKSDQ
jgi:hypothetical protein